jgi:hypothetical protein
LTRTPACAAKPIAAIVFETVALTRTVPVIDAVRSAIVAATVTVPFETSASRASPASRAVACVLPSRTSRTRPPKFALVAV